MTSHPAEPLPLTALVAVKNEVANIERCLNSLRFAERIIVVDSGSTDGTIVAAERAGAEVVQFRYRGGYPKKRQWAMDNLDIRSAWTLLIDADEVVPPALARDIAHAVAAQTGPAAYLVTKGFHFLGRRFRHGGFSHSAVIMFRTGVGRFERLFEDDPDGLDMEVHERLLVDGTIGVLREPLIHEDFKGLERYYDRHNRYSTWEAKLRDSYLTSGVYGQNAIRSRLFGNVQERRRFLKQIVLRMPFEDAVWFAYHYVFRMGFLEGRPGLIAARARAEYIAQVRAKLYEMKLARRVDRGA